MKLDHGALQRSKRSAVRPRGGWPCVQLVHRDSSLPRILIERHSRPATLVFLAGFVHVALAVTLIHPLMLELL